MARVLRIFLIRHAESEANLDQRITAQLPDYRVRLSEQGRRQAYQTGELLRDMLLERAHESGSSGFEPPPIRIWRSPYVRARETSDELLKGLGGLARDGGLILDVREKSNLREQEFGLFDGIPDGDLPRIFPREYALYRKAEAHGGRFWAPMPMGESRCDVAERVHAIFGTFHRDAERQNVADIIVVSHGVTIRAFVYAWMGYDWEWFERAPNPNNCSIWLLESGKDQGLVHPGYAPRPGHAAQEEREAGVIGDPPATPPA